MGCRNSKQEEILSLDEMRQIKENQDEVDYQKSLRKLEKYITTHNIQKELKLNGGRYFTVKIGGFWIDQPQFNVRNVSQINLVQIGGYPRFYPRQDQDIIDPHFL